MPFCPTLVAYGTGGRAPLTVRASGRRLVYQSDRITNICVQKKRTPVGILVFAVWNGRGVKKLSSFVECLEILCCLTVS